MEFIEESERLLRQIKSNIRSIENYIKSVENDNICVDTCTVEGIIEDMIDNTSGLYILTNPEY